MQHLNALRKAGKELKNNFIDIIPLSSKDILKSIETLIKERSLAAVEESRARMENDNAKRFLEMEERMNAQIVELKEKLEV